VERLPCPHLDLGARANTSHEFAPAYSTTGAKKEEEDVFRLKKPSVRVESSSSRANSAGKGMPK
jgi:hypothetical protein